MMMIKRIKLKGLNRIKNISDYGEQNYCNYDNKNNAIEMKKEKLPKAELDKRSNLIALAAIYYGDLKNSRENNVVFDLDKFTSFEGDTGPYLLYSYARANSILKKMVLIIGSFKTYDSNSLHVINGLIKIFK